MTLPNSSSINAYGSGILVDAVPLVDPTSELGAAALNPLRNDVSAMTAVSPRLLFQFLGVGSNPVVSATATWTAGNDSVWGNAPAVTPTMVRSSAGVILVTLPATVQDQLGNSILVNIRNADVHVGGSTPGRGQVSVTSASTFTIYLFNSSNAASDLTSSLIFVKVY
jgi:hypothetical protein